MNSLKFPKELSQIEQYGVFTDFTDDQSDLFFVDVITDSGSAAVNDAVNGVMVLTPSDGTVADNDEVYLRSANELFLFDDGHPALAVCRLQFTETTSGVYNAFFGFMSAIAANSLVDDGGGLQASGSYACIFKIDGETVWRCGSRNNGTVTTNTSLTAIGGASYQKLEIEIVDFTGTQNKVVYRIDGVPLRDSTTGAEIVHTVTVASATEMHVGAGAKLGAATNNDVLNLDYMGAWQYR